MQFINKFILLFFSFIWLSVANIASADICDIANTSGIGGTGFPMIGSGIGGTGTTANTSNSGIGGTGKPITHKQTHKKNHSFAINGSGIGGTGAPIQQVGVVVGTITGFGSICVNGIEIHYSENTPLHLDGQRVSPGNSFAIGQVVAVSVLGSGKEVIAQNMHILHSVTGPVTSINVATNTMQVLEQSVRLPANQVSHIKPGQFVAVSGLRNQQGNIIASRIDRVSPSTRASIRGPVTNIATNSFKIHGLTINTPIPQGIKLGQQIHVDGTVLGNTLAPDTIDRSEDGKLTAEIGGLISVEGYIHNAESIEISGKHITIPPSLKASVSEIDHDQKVIVTGVLGEDETIIANQILINESELNTGDGQEKNEEQFEKANSHQQNESQQEEEESSSDLSEHKKFESDDDSDTSELQDQKEVKPEHVKPEHEAPEAPENETPEAPEHETPEAPEHETPEAPEYEAPEAPEHEAPEVPEYEAPEVPEYEAPEVPEYEAPEVPEYEAPEVPEYEAPEVPEYEAPEVPEYEAPEVPEYEAPEVPEYEAPEVPEYEAPEH